ncbi:glycosyltransferase family 4 protein [Cellulomonas sp. NPDC089187]|uniref:glycosyltransferase family 4 protein n=1 Tax=Cellulomonas sp. NPDC089187 TaxID=3154970 RepID=UPI0034261072
MRVGIVCPYSFDAPGGVQFHIRDLAEALIARGHTVGVLAPADEDTPIPDYMTSAGRAVPVRYNGSVARLAFGPLTAARVRRWLEAGQYDVLHLHEPMSPSLSMLALWIADGPVVATFHSSQQRSRSLQVAYPLVRQSLEKISARIAVSEDARRTLVDHLGGDAVVIPNGVYVDHFAQADTDPQWTGTPERPTVAFLGRLDEPRKGLPVLLEAVPAVRRAIPGVRFLIAGRGDTGPAEVRELIGDDAEAVEFLGGVSDAEKAALFRSVDAYVAPQTGGESFGIVLVEAMSAHTPVVASDLGAFRRVLDEGNAGELFRTGDGADLARVLTGLLADPQRRAELADLGSAAVMRYDWSTVTHQILTVYEMAVESGHAPVGEDPSSVRGRLRRWRGEDA